VVVEDFKVSIESLEQGSVYRIEGEVTLDSVELEFGSCTLLKPLKVEIEYLLRGRELFVQGKVKTVLSCPCSRCLEPARVDIDGEIEAIYRPIEKLKMLKREEALEKLENVVYYSDPVVNLFERVIEAVVVEVPQKPLCKPDCKGLCPFCGENLNEHPEHHCELLDEFLEEARSNLLKGLQKGG